MDLRLLRGELFGLTVKSRMISGLKLTEAHYSPNLKIPRHSHEYAFFCLLLRGSYVETNGSKARTCLPATITFQNESETHAVDYENKGGAILSIELEPQWFERLKQTSITLSNTYDFQSGLSSALGLKIYREFRSSDEASSLAIEGLALELLAEASRQSMRVAASKPGPRIEQANEYLHAHFSDSIGLTVLAEIVGMHPVHLAREFRKRYGRTVGEQVRKLRIDYARHQIATSDQQLSEIALAAGFADQAHFSRVFKRLTGMTPAEFRAKT